MLFKTSSLRVKIREAILIVGTLSSIAHLLILGYQDIVREKHDLLDELKVMSAMISYNVTASLTFHDQISAKKILSSFKVTQQIVSAAVYTLDGNILAEIHSAEVHKAAPKLDNAIAANKVMEDQDFITLYSPVVLDNSQIGTLLIKSDTQKLKNYISNYLIDALTIFLCMFMIAFLFSEMMQRAILKPVSRFIDSIHQITQQGDYATRVEKVDLDEFTQLVSDFNNMLKTIEERDIQLKLYNEGLEEKIKERTQELIISKESAEKANRAKSEFLSSMSHELRTPMNAILGFAQLFAMDELDEEQRDNIDQILQAGQHLLELINEVLDLSKIESGNMELTIREHNFPDILSESLSISIPLAANKNVEIINQIAQDKEFYILGDARAVKQILINLLSNAIKYNKDHGKVIVSEQQNDNFLIINIEDTGHGLSSEQIEKLFTPFERFEATQSAIEGTGIGLVISKRYIEEMGGQIGVSSEKDIGSRFWFSLPIKT